MAAAFKLLEKNPRKKRMFWRYIAYLIGIYGVLRFVSVFIPISKKKKHSIFEQSRPLVMAHRGGAGLAPENTLAAFHHAAKLGVDLIELDIHMTKDGHLVVIHDNTIDRTTDGSGSVNDLMLADIQLYDAGVHFTDEGGNPSFRGKGVNVPTLESVFQEMPLNMRYTIELKNTNDTSLYERIGKSLWELMGKYDVRHNVLIGSFDQRFLDMMTNITNGEAIVSAGRQEVSKFVLFHKLRLHSFYRTKVDSIEMPMKAAGINFVDKGLINAAKKRGIDIHYWTINDRDTMKELIDLGVDGIISDWPDVLLDLMRE